MPASFYCGIIASSEVGDTHIKLIPWDSAYSKSHPGWPTVRGHIHIKYDLINGIVEIDTIDEETIRSEFNQTNVDNRG